jgi:hypothetical protein
VAGTGYDRLRLIEVQAMADKDNIGGIASLYYAITFLGFLIPAALSALARLAPSWLLLLGLAGVCAVCAAIVFVRSSRSPCEGEEVILTATKG